MDELFQQHNVTPGKYSAVHCRVCHPKITKSGLMKGKNEKGTADQRGLPWERELRLMTIKAANRAFQYATTFQCATTLQIEGHVKDSFSPSCSIKGPKLKLRCAQQVEYLMMTGKNM